MKNQFKVLCVASIAFAAFGCDKNGDHANRPPPTGCHDGHAIRIGEFVPITVAGADPAHPISWDTRGTELKLATGQESSVKILPDENYGAVIGSCLTTPNYIRLSRDRGEPSVNGYLIASPETVAPNVVKIGDFGPPNIFSRFFLEKIPGSTTNTKGPEIRVGDEFRIRSTRFDWWLVVPTGAGVGSKVELNKDPDLATHFFFSHGGPNPQPGP